MKILIAVDGSACSDRAVHSVAMRPWPAGTLVKLLSVIELPFVPTTETWAVPDTYYTQLEKAQEEKATAALANALKMFREPQAPLVEVTTDTRTGSAQEMILEASEEWGADLIVLGSHGYRGFKRFLLGSVSQAIASHAKCSVEIIRDREIPEE